MNLLKSWPKYEINRDNQSDALASQTFFITHIYVILNGINGMLISHLP